MFFLFIHNQNIVKENEIHLEDGTEYKSLVANISNRRNERIGNYVRRIIKKLICIFYMQTPQVQT